jgi:hypothetical protein
MVTVCAWCDRYLGPDETPVTHGICLACTARQHWRESPVLVVSRHREPMVPVLRHLLQGSPEVKIVVERREDERRRSRAADTIVIERRSGQDRRRRDELMLI